MGSFGWNHLHKNEAVEITSFYFRIVLRKYNCRYLSHVGVFVLSRRISSFLIFVLSLTFPDTSWGKKTCKGVLPQPCWAMRQRFFFTATSAPTNTTWHCLSLFRWSLFRWYIMFGLMVIRLKKFSAARGFTVPRFPVGVKAQPHPQPQQTSLISHAWVVTSVCTWAPLSVGTAGTVTWFLF